MTGIFDSGFGGLSVLKEIVRLLPGESYLYYADSAHCPYGEKTREYVIDRALAISHLLMERGADIIVVACNTATAAAIRTLRATWPDFPFVGMEPAVKPAALHTHSGVIGILATAGTLKGSNYLDLREKYSDKVRVVEHVGQGFVELVEKGILDGPEAEATVRASVTPLLDAGADTIVLGCTHYPFLEPVIRRVAGPDVEIINPAPAVARQVERLLPRRPHETGNPDTEHPDITVLSSGPSIPDDIIARFLNL
ncbi:MAG: glutamate racemase [Bacteroidales bacterium]|nr:glutamate racemase [Candidatus Hennigimonas equi]